MNNFTRILCWVGIVNVSFIQCELSTGPLSHKDRCARVIESLEDVHNVYPSTPEDIKERCVDSLRKADTILRSLKNRTAYNCTKEELLGKIDALYACVGTEVRTDLGPLKLFESSHPDEAMRNAAHDASQELTNYCIEHVSSNAELYELTKAVFSACESSCTPEEKYFFTCLLRDFKKSGLDLDQEGRERVVALKKELYDLSVLFSNNLAAEIRTLLFTKEELEGISETFLNGLAQQEDKYVIPINWGTWGVIINNCCNAQTREKFLGELYKKGYPENLSVLDLVIKKRRELALLLGYPSYAHYDLDGQTMQTPENAWKFQKELAAKVFAHAEKEMENLKKDLPAGVVLSKNGKIKVSDRWYVAKYFKEKYYHLDASELNKYFPIDKVISGLITIYQQFFGLRMKQVDAGKAWHPDVRLLEIANLEGCVLGYVYFDLFARPHKFQGAAHFNGISGSKDSEKHNPTVVTLVANFDRKNELLSYGNVRTIFHEFGHAIHSVLGIQYYAMQSGCLQTERDFIELPSQMLENWLEEKDILKSISSHYKTGEQLPDDLLDQFLTWRKTWQAAHCCDYLAYGMISLDLFDGQEFKDLHESWNKYREEMMSYQEPLEEDFYYCSLWHLIMYGPAFYGYLFTEIRAADVFEQIKKEGLLSPAAGKRYVDCILGRGASVDGNMMIKDYLGREATYDAFYKKMGF